MIYALIFNCFHYILLIKLAFYFKPDSYIHFDNESQLHFIDFQILIALDYYCLNNHKITNLKNNEKHFFVTNELQSDKVKIS